MATLNINPGYTPPSSGKLSILPPGMVPSSTPAQPTKLSILPTTGTAPVAPKQPFANTIPGIALNTITGIPGAVISAAKNLFTKPGGYVSVGEATGDSGLDATPLGIGVNTVAGIPKAAINVGKSIGQGMLQSYMALGNTLEGVTGTQGTAVTQVPKNLQPLVGAAQIKDLPTQYQDLKTEIQNSPLAQKYGLSQHAAPLALGGILAQSILDYAPLGGEDKTAEVLAKETDPTVVGSMLRKIGMHPEIADKIAPGIAASDDPNEIKTILKASKGAQLMQHMVADATPERQYVAPKDLTPEEQDAHLATLNTPEVQDARNVTGTSEPTYNIDDEARQNLRNSIVSDTYGEGAPKQGHRLDLVIGAPASGKSSLVNEIAAEHGSMIPDADEIKKMLPEYGSRGEGSQVVHKESTQLASEVRAIGRARGDNTILQTIGDDPAQLRKNIQIYKDAGYSVHLHLIELPPEKAAARAVERYTKGGHFIDPEYIIKKVGLKPSRTYDIVKNDEGISSYQKLSTDVERGSAPIRVESSAEGDRQGSTELRRAPASSGSGARGAGTSPESQEGSRIINGNRPNAITSPESEAAQTRSLAEIERMDQVQNPKVNGKPVSRTVADAIAETIKGPSQGEWQSEIKGFSRNIPGAARVHLLDYLGTPEFVLEKLGLGKGAEVLQDAEDLYRRNLKTEINKVIQWKKEVQGTPDASRRIFKYLDGQAKETKPEMTDTEYRVAKEMKAYLAEWADRLHLPPEARVSNYITHLFERSVEKPGENPFDDPELATIMQGKAAKSVYDPFLQKRVNKPEYKQDAFGALDAYVKRATRKEAMDPALSELAEMSRTLDEKSEKYVARLTHRINMRPTELDGLIDNLITQSPVGHRYTSRPLAYLSAKWRGMFYHGMLDLNVGTALRNLSQGANTYAKLGEVHTMVGYTKAFTHLVSRNLKEVYDQGILDDGFVSESKKLGVYKNILQKIDPALKSMFNTTEKLNRVSAYYGAKSKYYAKFMRRSGGQQIFKPGASEAEAIKYAKRMVRETQFKFGNIDTPVAMSGDIVKTLAQNQNYNLKQIEFLGRMVKNKEWAGLARYTAASLAFVATIGKAFGMQPQDLLPAFNIGGSPLVSTALDITTLLNPQAKAEDKTTAKNDLGRLAADVIPAGSQLRKTIGGISDYDAGRSKTATGKTRYTIPHTTSNAIQSALFGSSALPQAQKYYAKLDAPAKKKGSKSKLSI